VTGYVLHIPGRLPTWNDFIAAAKGQGGRGYGYAKLKRDWTNTVALLAKSARIPRMQRARFRFEYVEARPSKTVRERDPDNVAAGARKVIFDGLVIAKIIPDDKLANIAGWEDRSFSLGHPRVTVTIYPED